MSIQEATHLMPWVERYRPKKVSDVAHQKQVVAALKSSIESGKVPHLLFYGPPGTGKTSTILALAHELYGSHFRERVLELNASDERGISIVREKVKNFASTAVGSGTTNEGRKLPPFKLIILDEADSMTEDAQSALRRTMETYTRVTRFCLICNYVSRIIQPVASRCAKFRFEPLSQESFVEKIKLISEKENVQLEENAMETMIQVAKGDLRAGITLLQSAAQYNGGKVTSEVLVEMAGLPSEAFMASIWACIKSNNFKDLQACADNLQAEGYALNTVIRELQDQLLEMDGDVDLKMDDNFKAEVLLLIAKLDLAMEEGASEDLQFRALLSQCSRLYHAIP